MLSFETSLNQINKILENIRGYLWKKWNWKKVSINYERSFQRKLLERSKKS